MRPVMAYRLLPLQGVSLMPFPPQGDALGYELAGLSALYVSSTHLTEEPKKWVELKSSV